MDDVVTVTKVMNGYVLEIHSKTGITRYIAVGFEQICDIIFEWTKEHDEKHS